MATSRPFAYNTGSTISGTEQVGDIAIGTPTSGFTSTGLIWWNGPDEDSGYVIAHTVPSGTQPTPVPDDAITLSPTYKGTDIALSNNNQTASQIFSYSQTVLGETLISGSDKVMFSVKYTSTNPSVGIGGHFVGVGLTSMNYSGPFNGYPGNDVNSIGFSDDGKYYYNGSVVASGLPTWTTGDIIDIAISHGQGWFIRVNGGDWNNNPSADPTTLNGYLPMNGLTNFYPALCPYIYGTMEVLNNPTYGYPSGFNFLGNVSAYVGFWRTQNKTDNDFISLSQYVSSFTGTPQTFASTLAAKTWLNSEGYWTSYTPTTSLVLSLDAGDPASYPGTGTVWTDTVGGRTFNLINGPTYETANSGRIKFNSSGSQYAECSSSLTSLPTFTTAVWHNWDGSNTGGLPCILTEVYVGGPINYFLGNLLGSVAQSGYFNGGFQVSPQFTLTANNWYYIVTTCDSNQDVSVYINNTLVSTTATSGAVPSSSNAGIRLMRRWDDPDYWGGYLSQVEIYNEALTPIQIDSIWASTKSRYGL